MCFSFCLEINVNVKMLKMLKYYLLSTVFNSYTFKTFHFIYILRQQTKTRGVARPLQTKHLKGSNL